MKKALIIVAAISSVFILSVSAFSVWSSLPLYRPGMVREGKNLSHPPIPPAQSSDRNYWDIEPGVKLYHFSAGTGRNVLIVNGGPGAPFRSPMSGLEPLLSDYRFHYYDQRGCGESTRPFDRFRSPDIGKNMAILDKALGLGAQIADIERIRVLLGEERLIIIGHSWGAYLSALYAAEFPDRVEALVLVSPAAMLVMPSKKPDYFDLVKQKLPDSQKREFTAFAKDYLDFNKVFKKSEADLVAMNDRMGGYVVSVANVLPPAPGRLGGWMVWAMYASGGRRHDYRKAMGAITARTLVLCGSNDLMTQESMREYAELIPASLFVSIEGATHFVHEEQPERFSVVVGEFLRGR